MTDQSASEDGVPNEDHPEDLRTSFERMLEVLQQTVTSHDEIIGWIAAWLPLVDAVKSLAMTSGKLAVGARHALQELDAQRLLDGESLADFQEQFHELVEAFPEASALFFGVENIDNLVRETIQDEEARAVVVNFGQVVEAKMNGLIGRLVEWGLEDGAPELSVEKLEGFVRGLEALLQEVLDRWVLPPIYGRFEDK